MSHNLSSRSLHKILCICCWYLSLDALLENNDKRAKDKKKEKYRQEYCQIYVYLLIYIFIYLYYILILGFY